MKKLFALSLGLGAALFITSHAQAQGQQRNCAARDAIVQHLGERFGETRHGAGLGGEQAVIELFVSDETGTWTILVNFASGLTCMVAAGEAWQSLSESLPVPSDGA